MRRIVRCSAWLGHTPSTPIKLVQAGNKLCFCFVICGVSFLLAFKVWSSPTIKAGGFVSGNGGVKSRGEPACDAVPNFQNLGIQLRNLSGFWTEHKITGTSGLYAANKHGQITPEPLPLQGGVGRTTQTIANDHDDESTDSAAKNGLSDTKSSVMFFLSHVLSGMVGALVIAIAWWPNSE